MIDKFDEDSNIMSNIDLCESILSKNCAVKVLSSDI